MDTSKECVLEENAENDNLNDLDTDYSLWKKNHRVNQEIHL